MQCAPDEGLSPQAAVRIDCYESRQRATSGHAKARGGSAAGPRFYRSTRLPAEAVTVEERTVAVAAVAAIVIAGRGNRAGSETDSGNRAEGAETAAEVATETAMAETAVAETAMTETTEAVGFSGSAGGGGQRSNSGNRHNKFLHRNAPSFGSQLGVGAGRLGCREPYVRSCEEYVRAVTMVCARRERPGNVR